MKKNLTLLLGSIALLSFAAKHAAAQFYSGGIVPCGVRGDMCTLCHFVVMAQNIFVFLLKVSFVVALLLLIISGILHIVSAGSSTLAAAASSALKYTLLGFAFCLLAWLGVNFIAKALGYSGGSWFRFTIECEDFSSGGTPSPGPSPTPGPGPGPSPGPTPGPTANCTDADPSQLAQNQQMCQSILASGKIQDRSNPGCQSVMANLNECAGSGNGCVTAGNCSDCPQQGVVMNPQLLQGLNSLASNPNVNSIGIGAMAGGTHTSCNSAHYRGQAIDISRINGQSGNAMLPYFNSSFNGCSPGNEMPHHLHITC